MEQMKREIYNEMMHNYLAEQMIKEIKERMKLLDEDYAESVKTEKIKKRGSGPENRSGARFFRS